MRETHVRVCARIYLCDMCVYIFVCGGCSFTDEAPTLMELRQLTADADPAVLKFAVVLSCCWHTHAHAYKCIYPPTHMHTSAYTRPRTCMHAHTWVISFA